MRGEALPSGAGGRHQSRQTRNEVVFREVEVHSVEQLTPGVKRIVVGGESLRGFHSGAPDDHVKAFFPNEAGDIVFPVVDASGATHAPVIEPSPMRDFTPRYHDRERHQLVLDFAWHDRGLAAAWSKQAQVGQKLGIGGPRGSHLVADDFDNYVLLGDETALPAMGRWLESWHCQAPISAFIEIPHEEDRQALTKVGNAQVTWLPRNSLHGAVNNTLERALSALAPPAGDTFYWIAAESRRARAMRQFLLQQHSLPKEWVRATGYWQADSDQAPG